MATESDEQLAVGKRWVEEAFQRLAGEHKVPVVSLRWRDDFPGPYLSTLYFDVRDANQSGSIEFYMRQLEDCRNPARQGARSAVEDQIRASLTDLSKRLG